MQNLMRTGAPALAAATPCFPPHRPELKGRLQAGEASLRSAFRLSPIIVPARRSAFTAEQPPQLVYRVRSGWSAQIRHLKDGRTLILSFLLPGDLIALQAPFCELQADEVIAITETHLEAADHSTLRRAAESDPDFMLRLFWDQADQNRRMRNWAVALAQGTAAERIALLLVDLRARLVMSGLSEARDSSFECPLTQLDIAQATGLTAVHVNRTLRSLREAGLADLHGKRARIDLAGLHRLVQPLLDGFERSHPAFGADLR